jgi:peptidoglycan hydrolase CwlO-like protein
MGQLNTLLETKLASSDALVAHLNAELDVKQGNIDVIVRNLEELKGEVQEEREKLRGLNGEFQECSKKVTKIDRAQAS